MSGVSFSFPTAPRATAPNGPSSDEQEPQKTAGGRPMPRRETLADFYARADAEPEPTWLIPDLVPSDGKCLIVGKPNCGKTWLALLIIKSALAEGREVFFIEEEGRAKALAWRMRALGIEANAAHKLTIMFRAGVTLDDPRHRDMLVNDAEAAEAPVFIIDPLVSLSRADENSTKESNELRAKLARIADINQRALLVVLHHTSKAERDDDDPFMSRGSGIFSGFVDDQLNLKGVTTKEGSGRVEIIVTVAKARDSQRGLKRKLCIDTNDGTTTFETIEEDDADDVKARIIAVLRKAIEPMTKNGIVGAVGGRRGAVLAAVDALASDGTITKTGKGYELADAEEGGDE